MYCSDYHLHTWISSDSPASLEQQARSALEAGLQELCVTDHWNLLDQQANPLPRTRNWEDSIAQCREARQLFDGQLEIRLGIEVGNGEVDPIAVSEGLAQAGDDLDFVIGSLHNRSLGSGGIGIFTSAKNCQHIEEGIALLDDYMDTLAALTATDTFDVMGHVIYPLRYLPAQWQLTLDPYEEQLRELFRRLIETGRGIEFNTTQGHTIEEWIPVLKLYRDCGGEIITTGSDAHRVGQAGAGFMDAYKLLKELGFQHYCTYRNRKPVFHPLDI
jgi:histidinol-phosphatase (PHP family)